VAGEEKRLENKRLSLCDAVHRYDTRNHRRGCQGCGKKLFHGTVLFSSEMIAAVLLRSKFRP